MSGKIIERVRAREKLAEKNRQAIFKCRWATIEAEANKKFREAEVERTKDYLKSMRSKNDADTPFWRKVFFL